LALIEMAALSPVLDVTMIEETEGE